MTARCILALFVLTPLAGCSSSAPKMIEAPPALTGSMLAQVGGGSFGGSFVSGGGDAEERFAARAGAPRADHAPRTTEPARPGFGFDKPLGTRGGMQPTDADVARLLDSRLDLRAPARLVCVEAQSRREYVIGSAWGDPRVIREHSQWTVRPATPATLQSIRKALDPTARESDEEWPEVTSPTRQVFASINAIPGLFLPGHGDLGKVRYAAARVGADTLLVYARSTRVYTYRNGLANLYPTLVGLLLPGNETIVVSRVEGAIVDVRTGEVFCVAQGEARIDESSSPLLQSADDERQYVEESEALAALHMTQDLSRELAALEAAGRIKDHPGEASK